MAQCTVVAMYLKRILFLMRNITKFKPWELTTVVSALQRVYRYWDTEYLMDRNQEGFSAKWL